MWWCPKQQPARHAVETSKQRASLSSAEFLSIIFCIFLQMTQSPPPSPLIPPNYHFSSMSPHPTGTGCYGVARSCHEMSLSRMCVMKAGGFNTRKHTHNSLNQLHCRWRKVHVSIMWMILPLKWDGGHLQGIQGSIEDSLSLFLPDPHPQPPFFPFAFVAITAAARLSNPTVWKASLGWC